MQILRTIVWVLVIVALLIFSAFNWKTVDVQIWTNLVLETKLPALVVVAFLLGLVPTWLIHRGTRWRLNRRIAHLEAAARAPALARSSEPVPAPAPTADPAPGEIHRPLP